MIDTLVQPIPQDYVTLPLQRQQFLSAAWKFARLDPGQREEEISLESGGSQILGGRYAPLVSSFEELKPAVAFALRLTLGTAALSMPESGSSGSRVAKIEESLERAEAALLERRRQAWRTALDKVKRRAIRTGIRDLAAQHDHYLYGVPKRNEATRSFS